MDNLAQKKCSACKGIVQPLSKETQSSLKLQIPDWQMESEKYLTREFKFPDFMSALGFVNRIGELAEKEAHHPDIFLTWGKVALKIWTHTINGLSENDFILAAKIDQL